MRFFRLFREQRPLLKGMKPGQSGSLKTRPDGTVIDGHHRIKVLQDRGYDVDSLPREVIPKKERE